MAAGRGGRRFVIVTLGAAMVETIASRAATLGLASQLAAIRLLPFSIAEMIEDRDARRDAIAAAVRASAQENGVEAVLLGGAHSRAWPRRLRANCARRAGWRGGVRRGCGGEDREG